MIQVLNILLAGMLAKRSERGASAVEYGLLVAGIAVVIIAAVWVLGDTISGMFENASDGISEAPSEAPTGSGD